MKKILLSLTFLLLLAGCKTTINLQEKDEISILLPNGTPALSQMYIQEKKDLYNYKIDIVMGSDPLSVAFLTKSYDIIYAPLNLGAKMYNNNKNYKLLALVVDCNYYFVTKTDEEFNLNYLNGKDLTVFGESAMSGIITRQILSANNINSNITYVSSTADSQTAFILDNTKIVLVSEPNLSIIESKVSGVKFISLKEEYLKISNQLSIPQAACFIRSDIDEDVARRYLSYLGDSIKKVNEDLESSSVLGESLFSNFTKEILLKAIPRSEINFTSSEEAKSKCDVFFSLLNRQNPNLLGGELDEEFYFFK